jgi:hypothetical protein
MQLLQLRLTVDTVVKGSLDRRESCIFFHTCRTISRLINSCEHSCANRNPKRLPDSLDKSQSQKKTGKL